VSHRNILITQCLQNDFVKPLGSFAPLPNQLHIGQEEARRLMGEDPAAGPVARMMKWAYGRSEAALAIVHIRDAHDAADIAQTDHLRQFGEHCLKDSEGAALAFPVPDEAREVLEIESLALNDFVGTGMQKKLDELVVPGASAGVMGVWTEAKVFFLCYDLRARYPDLEIGVCSALTASSSRAQHFIALDQLARILGVRIFSSVGQFTRWLGGDSLENTLPIPSHADLPKVELLDEANVTEADDKLIRYLFRDCRDVKLKVLDGGYSGNLVLGAASWDFHGHQQVAHVLKIGPEDLIGRERTAFEQVEEVLGNNAPNITEFADLGGRGALKYRYATMGGEAVKTFQSLYQGGIPAERIEKYLQIVFGDQLGRFYQAATLEWTNLLEYYWYSPDRAPGVRKNVEELIGGPAEGEFIKLPTGHEFPNPCVFYERDLAEIMPYGTRSTFFSYVHGDLNGANIMVDGQDNVWLIDFFHTHRGHVLKDLIKMENDLLYIYTPVESADDLDEAIKLFDVLMNVEDLRKPLPPVEETGLTNPGMLRTYETLQVLRSFYPDLVDHDREPLQVFIGQMRYSAHTMSFFESNEWQKLWALHSTGLLGAEITKRLKARGPLRVDWIDDRFSGPGRLGVTLLPGRRDHRRELDRDIVALKEAGTTHIVPLLTDAEMRHYGVADLITKYEEAGFTVRRMPILDQGVSSDEEMTDLVSWLAKRMDEGAHIVVHCVGGLGRAGLVAGSFLKSKGLDAGAAIAEVRRVRTARALESTVQEDFVQAFEPLL
jgi:protein-tyrosine phosphatase/nicotinamidase-related amidase